MQAVLIQACATFVYAPSKHVSNHSAPILQSTFMSFVRKEATHCLPLLLIHPMQKIT